LCDVKEAAQEILSDNQIIIYFPNIQLIGLKKVDDEMQDKEENPEQQRLQRKHTSGLGKERKEGYKRLNHRQLDGQDWRLGIVVYKLFSFLFSLPMSV
jgi:hypothetical protein